MCERSAVFANASAKTMSRPRIRTTTSSVIAGMTCCIWSRNLEQGSCSRSFPHHSLHAGLNVTKIAVGPHAADEQRGQQQDDRPFNAAARVLGAFGIGQRLALEHLAVGAQ